jgi:glycosyltransferase involved in cell wall biosynthesis
MRILFVTPVIPTQSDGRRPFNFLKYLTVNHEVHLICFQLPEQSESDLAPLREMGVRIRDVIPLKPMRYTLNCVFGLPLLRPLRVSWCWHPEMRQAIRSASQEKFSLVHVDRMRMGQYLPWIDSPKVLDITDSLPLYLRRSLRVPHTLIECAVDLWELITIPAYERWASNHANAVLVCSVVDAEEVRRNCHGLRPDVIENGVDVRQFSPKQRMESLEPKLIITGTLWYFPNVDAVRFYHQNVLPAVRRRFPYISTEIIGARPTAELTRLNGVMGIRVIPNVPRMEDFLYTNDIYVCPLRVASGLRNKLLEAMAAGMAVVTTSFGAEGIGLQPEEHALFAETPDQFVSQIERLIDDVRLRQRLGHTARQYVIKNYTYAALGDKLESVYRRLLKR